MTMLAASRQSALRNLKLKLFRSWNSSLVRDSRRVMHEEEGIKRKRKRKKKEKKKVQKKKRHNSDPIVRTQPSRKAVPITTHSLRPTSAVRHDTFPNSKTDMRQKRAEIGLANRPSRWARKGRDEYSPRNKSGSLTRPAAGSHVREGLGFHWFHFSFSLYPARQDARGTPPFLSTLCVCVTDTYLNSIHLPANTTRLKQKDLPRPAADRLDWPWHTPRLELRLLIPLWVQTHNTY